MDNNGLINIYMIGVGGQGIGLLSEVLIRAFDYAGLEVRGVDTHGLAQRGGTVQSNLRVGEGIFSPLILKHSADIIISLEKTETVRAIKNYAKEDSKVIYYNTSWQTLDVRLENVKEVKNKDILDIANKLNLEVIKVFKEDLKDARMQNIVLLAEIIKNNVIEGLTKKNAVKALRDLMDGKKLEENLSLFNSMS